MNRYADFVCDHRGLLGLIILCCSTAAAFGLRHLEYDEEPRAVFRRGGEDFARLERLFADFGPDDADILVTVECDDLFTPESIAALRNLDRRLRASPGVASVFGILRVRHPKIAAATLIPPDASAERLREAAELAREHPMVAGQLLSADRRVTFLLVRLEGDSSALSFIEPAVAGLRSAVDETTSGTPLRVGLAGHPVARTEMIGVSKSEMKRYAIWSACITAVAGLIIFRRPAAVFVAMAGPLTGMYWTVGALGLMHEPLTGLIAVLPSLVFVIGFGDSIHLAIEFAEWRARGLERREALRQMLKTVGHACFLMVFTTVVGFGALVVAELEAVRRFGLLSALGTAVGFVAVQTVLPWLLGSRLGDLASGRGGSTGSATSDEPDRVTRWLTSAAGVLLRRPRTTAVLSVAGTVALAVTATRLRSDIRWMEMLPTDNSTAAATRLCDDVLGGSLLAYVVVEWPAEQSYRSAEVVEVVAETQRLLDRTPPLRGSFSYLNAAAGLSGGHVTQRGLQQLRRAPTDSLERLMRTDVRRAAVSVHVPDVGAARLLPVFTNLEQELHALERRHPGFQLQLTGTAVVAARNVYQIIYDSANGLMLSAAVIFATMMIAFRSVRHGLICIVPTTFPLAAAAAGLVLLDEPLRLSAAMTFCVVLGLADDNTIHFVSRYRHEIALGRPPLDAATAAMAVCGKAMLVMSVILITGLLPMTVGRIPPIRTFGLLSIFAIATAMIADLVMLPSLLVCFAPRGVPGSPERQAVARRK